MPNRGVTRNSRQNSKCCPCVTVVVQSRSLETFSRSCPGVFQDTNNLSLVTFLETSMKTVLDVPALNVLTWELVFGPGAVGNHRRVPLAVTRRRWAVLRRIPYLYTGTSHP